MTATRTDLEFQNGLLAELSAYWAANVGPGLLALPNQPFKASQTPPGRCWAEVQMNDSNARVVGTSVGENGVEERTGTVAIIIRARLDDKTQLVWTQVALARAFLRTARAGTGAHFTQIRAIVNGKQEPWWAVTVTAQYRYFTAP